MDSTRRQRDRLYWRAIAVLLLVVSINSGGNEAVPEATERMSTAPGRLGQDLSRMETVRRPYEQGRNRLDGHVARYCPGPQYGTLDGYDASV